MSGAVQQRDLLLDVISLTTIRARSSMEKVVLIHGRELLP